MCDVGRVPVSHRRNIALFLLPAMILAAFACCLLAPLEPVHQGRRLAAWLQDFDSASPQRRDRAAEAVRQMGAAVVPSLVEILRQRDSGFKVALGKWMNAVVPVQLYFRPAGERHRQAIQACRALGPAGRPAIPELIALLNDAESSSAAAHALAVIDLRIFPLSRALTDGNYAAPVRRSIALRLACGWYNPQQVVPALVQGLQDADSGVSVAAAESLKRIDPAAAARLGLK